MIKKLIIGLLILVTSFALVGYTFAPGSSPYQSTHDESSEYWVTEGDYRIFDKPIFTDSNHHDYKITLPVGSVLEYRNQLNEWTRVPSKSGTSAYNTFNFRAAFDDEWGGHWIISSLDNPNFLPITYTTEIQLDTFQIRYFNKDVTNLPEDQYNTVADLPNTLGSVFSETMDMGYANVNLNGLNMVLTVSYKNQHYYMQYSFQPGTDTSIFNDREAFYYTHEGEKFVVFNQGNYSMFTAQNVKTQTFIPFTVWNLTTNEIETFDRFNVYLYSKKEDANNAYAYFYVDEFIIDNLLSVSLAFKYRYNYMIGNQGQWQEVYKVLEADKEYFGDTTSWQFDLLHNATNALNVANWLTGNFPMLLIGTAGLHLAGQTDLVQQGKVMEIESVVPTTALKNEIEAAYKRGYSDFTTIDPNLTLFKLHLGQYNKEWSTGIEIDTEYSLENQQKGINIIQFTYSTQGQLYTVEGKNINPIFVPGPGTTAPDHNITIIDEILNGIMLVAGIIGALIVGFFLLKKGVLTDPKKFIGFLFIVGVCLLIYLGFTQGLFQDLFTK